MLIIIKLADIFRISWIKQNKKYKPKTKRLLTLVFNKTFS